MSTLISRICIFLRRFLEIGRVGFLLLGSFLFLLRRATFHTGPRFRARASFSTGFHRRACGNYSGRLASNVDRCVDVAVADKATGVAFEQISRARLGTGQMVLDHSAARACLARCIPTVDLSQCRSVPATLVPKLPPYLVVAADVKIFDTDNAIGLGYRRGELVRCIPADVGDPGVNLLKPPLRLEPVFGFLLLPGKALVGTSQLLEGLLQRLRSLDRPLFARLQTGGSGQRIDAKVNSDRVPKTVNWLDIVGLNEDRSKPPASLKRHRDSLGGAREPQFLPHPDSADHRQRDLAAEHPKQGDEMLPRHRSLVGDLGSQAVPPGLTLFPTRSNGGADQSADYGQVGLWPEWHQR
jgi:hypothetical protein